MSARADLFDLFDEAPCGFISVCPKGIIVRVNRTLAEWLGNAPEDLMNTPFRDLLSVGGRMAYETHIRPLLRMQGFVHEVSFDLLGPEDKRIPFIANASERRDADGEPLSTRFALFKSQDRRLYEKTLLEARKTAEAEVERERQTALLRDQFIAVLGHDLRNPLAAIVSGIRIMKRRATLTERDIMMLDEMTKSAWRAENLIKDVLDLARGTLGDGLVLQCEMTMDLPEVLGQVIEEIRLGAPERIIHPDLNLDRAVFCDSERVGQLLSNLLANAITHGDPAREINVSATLDDDMFTLSVENFGDPIPEHLRENLFQPFFRGEVRESRQGLGLGLFIVSEIGKAHGGQVAVDSTEQGTRFYLKMPRLAKETAAEA
jgi:sigma-B regulation protein RsbU (phosphoserine phosphatase)